MTNTIHWLSIFFLRKPDYKLFSSTKRKRPWTNKIINFVYQTKSSKVTSEKTIFFFEFTEKLFVAGGITSQEWKYFQRACVLPVVAKIAEQLLSEAHFFRYHSPGSEATLHQQVSWLKRRSSSFAPEFQSIREPWKTKNELLFSSYLTRVTTICFLFKIYTDIWREQRKSSTRG